MTVVKIERELYPDNPRDYGNSGQMICWHRRYNLGDEHNYDVDDFIECLACEWDSEAEDKLCRLDNAFDRLVDRGCNNGLSFDEAVDYANKWIKPRREDVIDKALDRGIILPLYLYDHSGLAMSTGPFACPWDSGQVGYIVCSPESLRTDFKDNWELAEKCLKGEVATYNQYIGGDVYGFVVYDDEDEIVDSCTGFYGANPRMNGMVDYIGEDVLDSAEVVYS